ncbi:MAG: hypothetical protein IKI11_00825 [Neisseriaceae bacterium]|nr:hypothetical protein [Neisseriaceae bacterium]
MSNEQWLCQSLRIDGYILDNASIIFNFTSFVELRFRQPERLVEALSKYIRFA